MKNNVILLLDTFFYITIWKGETIVKWEDARYQDDPSYENFKVLLEQPIEDAKYIMSERFPMPRFFICKPGDSNERKIKNRVNPSSLTANNATVEVSGQIVLNANIERELHNGGCQPERVHAAPHPHGRPVVKRQKLKQVVD